MSSSITGGSRDSHVENRGPSPHEDAGRHRWTEDNQMGTLLSGGFRGLPDALLPDGEEEFSSAQNNIFQRIREARAKEE